MSSRSAGFFCGFWLVAAGFEQGIHCDRLLTVRMVVPKRFDRGNFSCRDLGNIAGAEIQEKVFQTLSAF